MRDVLLLLQNFYFKFYEYVAQCICKLKQCDDGV